MDSAGNLYGTTEYGGSSSCSRFLAVGCGTVFKLDSSGKEALLYSFTGMNGDGANPAAGLIMDSAGNLYGTTLVGGLAGGGTVFKLDPSRHETVFYSFTLTNGDGANPTAGLIMDRAGNFYGTTGLGGLTGNCPPSLNFYYSSVPTPAGCGTVFKLDPSGKETVLYSFTGTIGDGPNPVAGLIIDSAGNLYGTTQFGGSVDAGTVFRLELPPDFSFSPGSGGSTSATVTAGQTATYNLLLNPAGGFSGSVSLACSGAPAQATCSISPASLTVSGTSPVPFTVTITTMAATSMASTASGWSASSSHGIAGQRYALLFAILLLAAIKIGTRRAGGKRAWAPIGSLVCLTIALVACGGSSSTGGGGRGGTPAGMYKLTVTGTSQKINHTLALTLTVK